MRQQAIRQDQQSGRETSGRSRKGNERRWQNRKPRLAIAPSPTLILPKIPATIPETLTVTDASTRAAKIVLSLLDLGLVNEEDVRGGNLPHEVIASALTRWVEERSADLKQHFDLRLGLTDSMGNLGYSEEMLEQLHSEEPIPENSLKIAIYFGKANSYFLSEKVEALEKAAPGLGETALSRLYSALHQTMFAVTPCYALDEARHYYWMGEENEECAIEEMGEDEESYDGLKRSEFDEWIPAWAANPCEKLSRDQIEALAQRPGLTEVCNLLLENDENDYPFFVWSESLSEDGYQNLEYGCFLSWRDGDPVGRIFDDWANYMMQIGTTDLTGVYFLEPTTEGIADALNRVEKYLKRLSWGAKLLTLLGTVR